MFWRAISCSLAKRSASFCAASCSLVKRCWVEFLSLTAASASATLRSSSAFWRAISCSRT
ncbi:hypothetical protein FXB75_08400 [Aggregatibacter actinomycetemcomitans]|nr:hypothetical protein FXB75_08400 [Aggregatibacter actinomycetemcomitans]